MAGFGRHCEARSQPGRVGHCELLCYPDPAAAPRDGDYFYGLGNIWYDMPKGPDRGSWTMDDWCRSGVFVDLPEKHAYIAFVKLANGRIGYDYGAMGPREPRNGGISMTPKTSAKRRRDGEAWRNRPSRHGQGILRRSWRRMFRQAEERGTRQVGGWPAA